MRAISTSRIAACLLAAGLVGCASTAPRLAAPEGGYCFRIGPTYRAHLTCTTAPIPSAAVEAEAKRFEPVPDEATLYVVRRRWADAVNRIPIRVDDQVTVDTIPNSFVRVRLPAGIHVVSMSWRGSTETRTIDIKAGDLRFVEIDGAVWSWSQHYAWADGDAEGARQRALKSKLIADVHLDPRR